MDIIYILSKYPMVFNQAIYSHYCQLLSFLIDGVDGINLVVKVLLCSTDGVSNTCYVL